MTEYQMLVLTAYVNSWAELARTTANYPRSASDWVTGYEMGTASSMRVCAKLLAKALSLKQCSCCEEYTADNIDTYHGALAMCHHCQESGRSNFGHCEIDHDEPDDYEETVSDEYGRATGRTTGKLG